VESSKAKTKIKSPEKRARIGERIKLAATSSGLTLKELAERAQTTPALIYQYVRGITNVPLETLEAIAKVTGVSLEFFDPDKDMRSALALSHNNHDGGGAVTRQQQITSDIRRLQQLAEAYDTPGRNMTGLLSVYHEMLALARVSNDPNQEAYALWRIGAAHNEMGDYEEARQYLIQAQQLFNNLGLEEYRVMTVLDLAHSLAELGMVDAAIECSREVASAGSKDLRWRAFINIGGLYYRQHNYEAALKAFLEAARALEEVDEQQKGMSFLMSHIADIAKDTGHYEAALALWSRSLAQATEEKRAEVFLESLLNTAQCCQMMGKISEARQKLEQAIVLASFLFDDQNRLSVARGLMADVMVALGSLEEAKENAKSALRLATRVGGPRGMILASLALAETCLASGQYDDALSYADEAIREAQRSRRPFDLAQARNLRARICLQLSLEDDNNGWLREAEAEARRALEVADRVDASKEQIAGHLTLARCLQGLQMTQEAEEQAQIALEIVKNGAVGLPRLLGEEIQNVPHLLKEAPIELEKLFSGRGLQLPGLEWQAHYLQGTLRAKRLGPEAAFAAMRDAARALGRLLSGLTEDDARRFQQHHPEVTALYEDLARFALTEADQREAFALLQNARLFSRGERTSLSENAASQQLPPPDA
jgi:tetratricopeptide (TPR) repeat protein